MIKLNPPVLAAFIAICIFYAPLCFSQAGFISSGGDLTDSGGSESFSLGLIDYVEIYDSNRFVQEGIQQTYTDDSTLVYQLSGVVETSFGVPVNQVKFKLESNDLAIVFSYPSGQYEFEVESNTSYELTAEKDTNWLDGVSTIDLVLIQSHILLINEFDSPYQIIASDANRDEAVTTLDLVLLQILIIGLADEISSNTSWRFIPESFQFSNPEDPFEDDFPELIEYQNIASDLSNEHWVAVKVGDVSGDAGQSGIRRTNDSYLITAEESFISEDCENKTLTFTAGQHQSLSGIQLELRWDPFKTDQIDYRFDQSKLDVLDGTNFLLDRENGIFRLVWYNAPGQSLQIGDELFRLEMKNTDCEISFYEQLETNIRGIRWLNEAYTLHGKQVLNLNFELKVPTTNLNRIRLYQNQPNPFSNVTIIPFYIPQGGAYELNIYTTDGKFVQSEKGIAHPGKNYSVLSLKKMRSGSYIYQLKTDDYTSGMQMIKIE